MNGCAKLCPHGVCEKSPQRRIALARRPDERSSADTSRSSGRPCCARSELTRQCIDASSLAEAAAAAAVPEHPVAWRSDPAAGSATTRTAKLATNVATRIARSIRGRRSRKERIPHVGPDRIYIQAFQQE